MINTLLFVFYIELLLSLRRSQAWLYPLGFFLIIISLFPLAFTPDPVFLQKYIPGCIWIAALLASLLSAQMLFFTDFEDGNIEQLILSPLPLTLLILPKLIVSWLVTALPLILLTPLVGLMFHLSASSIASISLSLLLGTPVLTLVGGLGIALSHGLRQQGALLGLLILPLVTPILILGVSMAQQEQAGFSITTIASLMGGLFVFAMTVLPWAIASAVRLSAEN